MADNVPITAGSGTPIATDEVSGTLEHVQLFKMAIDSNGSRTLVPATAANGITVDVTRVQGAATPAVTSVTAAVADTALKASNAARRGLVVYNASTSVLYLKYGSGASTTSYTIKVLPDQYWEMGATLYTGAVNGYWEAAQGAALVTELTA